MILQQIHGTTLLLHFAGKKILIDPVLSLEKSALPLSPATNAAVSLQEILQADAVILTSLYPERFDDAARKLLPKTIPVYVQDRMDQAELKHSGFTNVQIVEKHTHFGNIALTRTPFTGNPNGVLMEHPAEKSLLITGDSVWNDGFLNAIHTAGPRAIAVNCGTEELAKATPCQLTADDIWKLHEAAPQASLITCQIEAFHQWGLDRLSLQQFMLKKNFNSKFLIPENGKNYYL
ncbi:MBL fold metallo-hydrolase [Blautia sp. HCP3S3_G3]|uniref:MBL fold metallo-hydrolase n=1 Tax=Blautia sp. HCP3S3_G3 TaxID=3438913 RepID=UPI003F8C2EE7